MMSGSNEATTILISDEADAGQGPSEAMMLAESIGFSLTKQYMIATAVSELARNIVNYASKGRITLRVVRRGSQEGIEIVAEDNGPGIEDVSKAMQDHFSTSGSLGLGLPGARRLMDEFSIESEVGKGTRVTARKWT
jgi:serine/threonine-protein kinase RsbT